MRAISVVVRITRGARARARRLATRMTHQEMIELLERTCIYCGGAMGVRALPEEEFP